MAAPTAPAGVALLAVLLAGCQSYHAAPLSPDAHAAALESRSLDDPRLHRFLTAAGAPDPVSSWDLTTLSLAALYFHPALELARADLAEALAGVRTARQLPNPSLGFEDLAFTPRAPAGARWTVAPLIEFTIETAGKRRQRTAVAESLVTAARADLASAAWQVRAGVRDALIALWTAQRRADLSQRRAAASAELAAALERRVAAGEESQLELVRAHSAAQQAAVAVDQAERDRVLARSRLAAAVGLPARALDGVALDLAALDRTDPAMLAPPADAQVRAALTSRSDLRAALADYAAAEAGLALAVADQYPDLTLSPGYSWDAGAHRFLLLPASELPVFNRNQGPIAEARAHRQAVAARFDALQAQVLGAIDVAQARCTAARRALDGSDVVMHSEEEHGRRTDRLFAAGEIDRGDLLAARLERLAAEEVALNSEVDVREALAAREDALEQPVFGPALPPAPESDPRAGD